MNHSAAIPSLTASRFTALNRRAEWEVLIVSADLENRKALLGVLEELPIAVFSVDTIEQARDLLRTRFLSVIFCDESLPDGSYRQLLETVAAKYKETRFVVALGLGEWEEYLRAMRSGATDVLRCPLQAIEVELVLIRASRDRDRLGFDVMA